jgi:DNA-binding XRE family transcriptional regulator
MDYYPFDEHALMQEFARDVRAAKHLVLLHVPYATPHAVKRFRPVLQAAVAGGARLCVQLLKPEEWDRANFSTEENFDRDKFGTACQMLVELGAHVTMRSDIHEKFCILDGRIVWDSSLNYLSWNRMHDSMNRFICPDLAHLRTFLHRLQDCDGCDVNPGHRIFAEREGAMSPAQLIAHRVRTRRHQLELTQRELAERAGCSYKSIAELEAGDSTVAADIVIRAHRAMDLVLAALVPALLPATDAFFEGDG